MTPEPTCPRCSGGLRPPGFWSSDWRCERHGAVLPFHVAPVPTPAVVESLVGRTRVPVWVPHPLPSDWTVTGIGHAGDDRTGARASVVALSGPAPGGGLADLLLVAEEPGIGLGARFAGLAGTDPGQAPDGAPDLKVEAAGHPTALWRTAPVDDRCALAGEAKGLWLWAIVYPEKGLPVMDRFVLHDLRDGGHPEAELVFGARTPRLA